MDLERKHDLSAFCEYESRQYDLDTVKYDPVNKCLMATDGKVCMFVPLDGGDEEFYLSGEELGNLFNGKASVSLSPDGEASVSLKRNVSRWPNVAKLAANAAPYTHSVIVTTKMLNRVAEYAKQVGAESVHFGFSGTSDVVRVVFSDGYDDVLAYALFSPAERYSSEAVDMIAKAFGQSDDSGPG